MLEENEQPCVYIKEATCLSGEPKNAGECLECLASGMANTGVHMLQVIQNTIMPYAAAKDLVLLEMEFDGDHKGLIAWFLKNSQHPERKAGLIEADEQRKQSQADLLLLKNIFENGRSKGR